MSDGGAGGVAAVAATPCRSCGAALVPDARFCASCGTAVAPRSDERRVVTVLFADLVGFTGLAEHLDPESVKDLVDRCFQRLAVDIVEFGGRVDKIVGDAVLALFGAPLAHEDDAERAVRCGLRMQQTLAEWCAGASAAQLEMRVGINTGEVLVGALRAAGEWTAMGDVVNTASRLQNLAEPGTVVVGADTHAATVNAVRYRPLGEVTARGREAPVEAWVAEEPIALPGHRVRRATVPLVGRDTEVALLGGVVDAAVRRQRAAAVVVLAEAGMGKTRIVEAVAAQAGKVHGAAVFEGRCVPYGEANPLWPVAESIRTSIGIPVGAPEDETASAVRDAVVLALGEGADDAEVTRVADGLLHLLDQPTPLAAIDPQRARDEVLRSLTAHLEGLARQRPLVVLVTDAHWADDALLELGEAVLERLAALPILLVYTARASLLERWSPRLGRHDLTVLHVEPLGREAASKLLDHLAGPLPDDVHDLILARSGGNPFFMEELVALLEEGGMASEVPHTLRGLAAARLDTLAEHERTVLEDGAILGRRFLEESIVRMGAKAHGLDRGTVVDAVDALVAKDFLSRTDDVLAFRSELVREVAYSTLTKADRIKGHHGVASWLEEHPGARSADIDRIAHHRALAAELALELGPIAGVPADLPARAVAALERAARAANDGELHPHARRLASQGFALATAAGLAAEERLRLLLLRARASTRLRDVDEAESDLAEADLLAAETRAATAEARVLAHRADLLQKRGDFPAATVSASRAIEIFRAHGELDGAADALLLLGMSHLFAGEDAEARAAFAEAHGAFRDLGDRRGEAWALQNLAWVAYSSGRIAEADGRIDESIAIFRELGDRGGLGWAQGLQAFLRFHQSRFEEAEALAEGLFDEATERGDPWAIGMVHSLRASLRLWTGRAGQAVEPAEAAVERFQGMGDSYGALLALGALARALVATGRIDDGAGALYRAMDIAERSGVPSSELIASTHAVTTAAQAGQPGLLAELGLVAERRRWSDAHAIGEIGFTDRLVAEALLRLQEGDAAGAVALAGRVVDELGEAVSGYALAALALTRAGDGDVSGATAAAGAVDHLVAATYLDRTMAATARMLALARSGDGEGSDDARATAKELVAATEDRLAQELLALAAVRADAALGRPVAPGAGSEVAERSPGWDRAYRLAAGLAG